MKKFYKLTLLFLITLLFVACEKKDDNGLAKIHWDRDMCERCVMVISEKGYAVQIENPTTKRKHKFDDIGCAILWFKENNLNWFDTALIWVKDEKNQDWINARTSLWTYGNITPMNYGLAAYTIKTLPQGQKSLTFKEAIKLINDQDYQDRLKRQHQMHKKGNQ